MAAASPTDSSYSLSHTSYIVTYHVEVVMLRVANKIIFILHVFVWFIPNPLTFHLELSGVICPVPAELPTKIFYLRVPSILTTNHKHSKCWFPSIHQSLKFIPTFKTACHIPYPELKNSVHIFTLYWVKIQQQYHPTSSKFFLLKVSMNFPSNIFNLNASQQRVKRELCKWATGLGTGTCYSCV